MKPYFLWRIRSYKRGFTEYAIILSWSNNFLAQQKEKLKLFENVIDNALYFAGGAWIDRAGIHCPGQRLPVVHGGPGVPGGGACCRYTSSITYLQH